VSARAHRRNHRWHLRDRRRLDPRPDPDRAGASVYEVAPATLAATFLTSIAGICTYQALQLTHSGAIAPQWVLGAFLGAGGFAGSYCGARLQRRLPERSLRRLLGLIACLVAARYLQTAFSPSGPVGNTRTADGATLRPTS